MEADVFVIALVAVVVFAFVLIGGPAVLTDRIRRRREEVIRRQIALTDAIDGTLGTIVSPVVRKPVVGPWQIQITVPFDRAAVVGRILAITRDVFSTFDGQRPNSFRVVLSAAGDSVEGVREPRAYRRARNAWTGKPAAA